MRSFFALFFLWPGLAFAAGTISLSPSELPYPIMGGQKITVTWVADSSDGSVPTLNITMAGLVLKVVTNPGSTAPTDNYDIACGDPSDSALDVFAGALLNRDTATTEQVYPVVSGATAPVLVTTCTLAITNNSVNSATGTIDFYVLRP